MLTTKTEIRVRYADTDQMQFVYNGKYLEYFEVGRTEMLREVGLPYNVLETEGYQLPVLEAYVKYHHPAYYDEVLVIESCLKEEPTLKIHIDYKVKKKDSGELVAEGYTVHVFIKKENKKAVRPPEVFINTLKKFYTEKNV